MGPAAAQMESAGPLLTVCVPTFERPLLLGRALRSIVAGYTGPVGAVEILVSDNSPDISTPVVERHLATWGGPARHLANRPTIGAIENFNRAVDAAAGRWVLLLHDDDYLLPGGLDAIVDHLASSPRVPVILFGVVVADGEGNVRRRQEFATDRILAPAAAVRRVLSDSSFIRIPAMVVRRDALLDIGGFDPAVGNPADFDLHVRLLGRYGLECRSATVAAYTVHQDASTTGMFNLGTLQVQMAIFERARATGIVTPDVIGPAQADWFHQFILGGVFRALGSGDAGRAREVIRLFDEPSVRALGPSRRWLPVRLGFSVLLRLPDRLASRGVRLLAGLAPPRIWIGAGPVGRTVAHPGLRQTPVHSGPARSYGTFPGVGAPLIDRPTLTVAIPAYDRPELLSRALGSVVASARGWESQVEIVVSDDSRDDAVGDGAAAILAGWPGPSLYARNRPPLGLVENFNRCIELATGRSVLILHDDDRLRSGAIGDIVGAIGRSRASDQVWLFGVRVVDESGRLLRRQGFATEARLEPGAALRAILSDSSFVRFPAIVVARDAYEAIGRFDPSVGNPTDFEMWLRLFGRFGLRCIPTTVADYTVHEGALSSGMFNETTILTLLAIFDRAVDLDVLEEPVVRRLEADWFHQFIVAGAVRRLRRGDTEGARAVLALFDSQQIEALGGSRRWRFARGMTTAVSRLPGPVAGAAMAGASRLMLPWFRRSPSAPLPAGRRAHEA